MDRLCRILIFVQSGQFNVIPSTGILDQCTQNILALLPLARDTERSKYYSAKGGSETKQLKALLLSWGSPGVSWLGWMESLAVDVVVVVVAVVVAVVVGGADCCWSCGRLSPRRGVVHSWGVQACQCWTHLLTCHWSRPHYHLHHLSHSHQHTNQIETHTTEQSRRYQPGVTFSSFP